MKISAIRKQLIASCWHGCHTLLLHHQQATTINFDSSCAHIFSIALTIVVLVVVLIGLPLSPINCCSFSSIVYAAVCSSSNFNFMSDTGCSFHADFDRATTSRCQLRFSFLVGINGVCLYTEHHQLQKFG